MCRTHGSRKKLGAEHGQVVGQGQGLGLGVEVLYVGFESGAGGDTECLVLDSLELFDVC